MFVHVYENCLCKCLYVIIPFIIIIKNLIHFANHSFIKITFVALFICLKDAIIITQFHSTLLWILLALLIFSLSLGVAELIPFLQLEEKHLIFPDCSRYSIVLIQRMLLGVWVG